MHIVLIVIFLLSGSAQEAPQVRMIEMPDSATCMKQVEELYKNPPPADKVKSFRAGCTVLLDEAKGV